jgi:hypothetical protein
MLARPILANKQPPHPRLSQAGQRSYSKDLQRLADYAPGFPRVTEGARITPALENESLLQSPKEKQITKGNGMNTGRARRKSQMQSMRTTKGRDEKRI